MSNDRELRIAREGEGSQPRWTAKDVAEYLRVPVKRVYEMGIPEIRYSERTIRYDPVEVMEWVEKKKGRRGER